MEAIRGKAGRGRGCGLIRVVGAHQGAGPAGDRGRRMLTGSMATVGVIATGCSGHYSILVAGFIYIYLTSQIQYTLLMVK